MRRGKNKTFYFLILGFVFLFLVSRMHFKTGQGIIPKEIVGADPTQTYKGAQLLNTSSSTKTTELTGPMQGVITTDSPETTHPSSASSGRAPIFTPRADEVKEGLYYKVAKVVDGDTIDIMINGKTERLRLIGINTPEVVDPRKTVECFGREASDNAKKLLSGQEVRVKADSTQDDRDKYGRQLRYVWRRDGLFYNLEAIKDGYAYEYTYQLPYTYQKDFKAAQKNAQEKKLGLWADGACGEKNIKPVNTNNLITGACVIKGNISSNSSASAKTTADEAKIYHLPECAYYKQTVIDESKGEKWFCSEAEAIAAGWRKAKNCP
jgi:micrococcal nuclease